MIIIHLERAPLLVWSPCARNRFLSGETEDGVDVDVIFLSFSLFYRINFSARAAPLSVCRFGLFRGVFLRESVCDVLGAIEDHTDTHTRARRLADAHRREFSALSKEKKKKKVDERRVLD